MNYPKAIKLFTALLVFSITLVSCGDDPASVGEEPPKVPTVDETIQQPDLSYFQNNNPQKSKANISTENFNSAKAYATGLSSFATFAQIYSGFFNEATQADAEFVNGQWIWEYTYTYNNKSATVVLVAEETDTQTLWSMTWSFDAGEGNAVEDYTILEGSLANDEASGSWTFNFLVEDTNEEIPLLITNWEVESESEVTIDTDIYNEDGAITQTFSYEQSGQEFTLSLTGDDVGNNILVYWNTDTMTGYYQIGSDESSRNCWDENFQDTDC